MTRASTAVWNSLLQVRRVVLVLWANLEEPDHLVCLDQSVTLDLPASPDQPENKVRHSKIIPEHFVSDSEAKNVRNLLILNHSLHYYLFT